MVRLTGGNKYDARGFIMSFGETVVSSEGMSEPVVVARQEEPHRLKRAGDSTGSTPCF